MIFAAIASGLLSSGIAAHAGKSSKLDSLYNCFEAKQAKGYLEEANKILLFLGEDEPLAEDISYNQANSILMDMCVDYYRSQSDYTGRLLYLNKALSFYTAQKDSMNIARSYHTLGATYQMLGLYDKALVSYQASSDILNAIGGDHSRFRYRYTLNNIAALFFEQGEMDKCEEIYLTCLSMINDEEDEHRNPIDRSTYLGNLAMVYNAKAERTDSPEKKTAYLEAAQKNGEEAVAIAKQYCDGTTLEIEVVKRAVTLARTRMLQGDLRDAERILRDCDTYIERNSLEYQRVQVIGIRAEIEERRGGVSQAEAMYLQVYDYAVQQGLKEMEGQTLESLYSLLKSSRPAKALEYYEKRTAIRDSSFTIQQNVLLSEFEVKYKTQEKENLIMQQKSKLRQSHIIEWSLAVILLLCLGIVFGIHRYMELVRQRNRELKESNATKDKMISIISHDLKNPAFAQRNALRSLSASYPLLDSTTLGQYVNELLNSSESQVQLLSNLLDWARLQMGKLGCNMVECTLSAIIGNELKTVRNMADNKQITINVLLSEDDTAIADRVMISIVIRNLITNAIKFSRKGGSIEVETGVEGDKVYCSVTDHGVGIAEDKLKQVFTDAAVASGTADEPGTGLGLELCKSFIDINNGSIEVQSKPDEGSRFTFHLNRPQSI